jgi:Succinate dehydrogenase/Fumarate reductase transmembrane subunit.
MTKPQYSGPQTVPTRLDFFQATTGVLLILFLWAHLIMVGSVVISPKLMNILGCFFEATYMAQVGGPTVFLIMLAHFVIAARKMPFNAGELGLFWKHSREMNHKDTWLWLVQVLSALVVLVLASIHMFQILTNLPITAENSAVRVQGGWLPFYLVLLPVAELHVGIGLYRLGVKYGYITRANRKQWQFREYMLMLFFVLFGLLTLWRLWMLGGQGV